ncbi:hypothetical protein DL546_005649 [Coniochaeta pulveracea]|uniref:Uncharacterized protein n=1 Tax=Coniochaeta pulveracea TaxID=177199 RepID=A0A420Y9Q8_9PEZI|nr:hypothetical protein DL546_005649 [Coniochaeta pulveracea]
MVSQVSAFCTRTGVLVHGLHRVECLVKDTARDAGVCVTHSCVHDFITGCSQFAYREAVACFGRSGTSAGLVSRCTAAPPQPSPHLTCYTMRQFGSILVSSLSIR